METNTAVSTYDRILGCWIGKNIGGTLGAPYECRKEEFSLTYYDPVPRESAPNDDLDLQIVWLDVVRAKGRETSAAELGDAWLSHVTYPCDEYGVALANLRLGLKPPETGHYNNWFFRGMGSPIRSEIWACLFPGRPGTAAWYAYQDACVDHWGEGIHGEIFLAALESAALASPDLAAAIDTGLSFLPPDSEVASCVRFARDAHRRKTPLTSARNALISEYGRHNVTDCVQNIGFTMLGLLYGEGDFGTTILSAVNCGYDTDCTGATAGAIMGILLGAAGIPERWRSPIGDALTVGDGIVGIRPPATLAELTAATMAAGADMARDGGLPALPRPFALPPKTVSATPLSVRLDVTGTDGTTRTVEFPDRLFDLAPHARGGPGVIKMRGFMENPSDRTVRILPACNDGVTVRIDGAVVLSHHEHRPIRPAPHFPDLSIQADVRLAAGSRALEIDVSSCGQAPEFVWVVADTKNHWVTDISHRPGPAARAAGKTRA